MNILLNMPNEQQLVKQPNTKQSRQPNEYFIGYTKWKQLL